MELARERAGKTPKIVRTDKLASHINGVEDAFRTQSTFKVARLNSLKVVNLRLRSRDSIRP
jgi:hypothetical protein